MLTSQTTTSQIPTSQITLTTITSQTNTILTTQTPRWLYLKLTDQQEIAPVNDKTRVLLPPLKLIFGQTCLNNKTRIWKSSNSWKITTTTNIASWKDSYTNIASWKIVIQIQTIECKLSNKLL